jgi:hypothetical protein
MTNLRAVPNEPVCQSADMLTHMSKAEFAAAWKVLVGEPPATMLKDRSEMIRVLVESTSIAPLEGVEVAVKGDQAIPAQSLDSPARAPS